MFPGPLAAIGVRHVVIWCDVVVVLGSSEVCCPFVVFDGRFYDLVVFGLYVAGYVMHHAASVGYVVRSSISSAVNPPLPRFTFHPVLMRRKPSDLDIVGPEPVHLCPNSDPNVDHWVTESAAVPSAFAEGVPMVYVVRDNAHRRACMLQCTGNGLELRSWC